MWTAVLGTNSKLVNRFVYEENLKFEVDSNGERIITDELEQQIEMRKPETWKVATFWAVPK